MHKPFMGPEEQQLLTQYALASRLLDAMGQLRSLWMLQEQPPGLGRSDMWMLMTMRGMETKKHPITVSSLARQLHQSVPSISQKLPALEKAGLLQREGDDKDRRVTHLMLTPKGRTMTLEAHRDFLSHIEEATLALGEQNCETLLSLLEQLGKNLQPIP